MSTRLLLMTSCVTYVSKTITYSTEANQHDVIESEKISQAANEFAKKMKTCAEAWST